MVAKKGKNKRIVYSTNPDFEYEDDFNEELETLPNNEQLLYVSIDRKQRKGKSVTLIEGFIGTNEDLKSLGKRLKSHCGVGGTVKDETIEIQGDQREKIINLLNKDGFKVKKKGG